MPGMRGDGSNEREDPYIIRAKIGGCVNHKKHDGRAKEEEGERERECFNGSLGLPAEIFIKAFSLMTPSSRKFTSLSLDDRDQSSVLFSWLNKYIEEFGNSFSTFCLNCNLFFTTFVEESNNSHFINLFVYCKLEH